MADFRFIQAAFKQNRPVDEKEKVAFAAADDLKDKALLPKGGRLALRQQGKLRIVIPRKGKQCRGFEFG